MTKIKGQAASFSAIFGNVMCSVSALAIGATLSVSNRAAAGDCTGGAGVYFCTGGAAVGGGAGVSINEPGAIVVTIAPGFEMSVNASGDDAINLDAGDITFIDNNTSTIATSGASSRRGIDARSDAGGVSITTTGDVTGTTGGIRAYNYMGSGPISIEAVNVSVVGGTFGTAIEATNYYGASDISITTTGDVNGISNGIFADNYYAGGSVTIDVHNVTGTNSSGVIASNTGGTDVFVTASGNIIGGVSGISATNDQSSGAITIEAVDVIGTSGTAISARNSGGTDISITALGDVTGGVSGIVADGDNGIGQVSVTVSGNVQGGSGAGILTETNNSVLNIVDLQSGASVSAASGDAITNNGGSLHVKLRDGSQVTGAVSLGDGTDALTVEGGADIRSATLFDGGAGTDDALTFSGYHGIMGSGLFENWETLTAQDSSNLNLDSASAAGFSSISLDSGSTIITSNADFTFDGDLQIGQTARFAAGAPGAANIMLNGNVLNNGLISFANGSSSDKLTFGRNLNGSGVISLDIDLGTGEHDEVLVIGDSAGATQGLDLDIAGRGEGIETTFTLVTVEGTSTANDFQLVNGDFTTNTGAQAFSEGDIVYRLVYDANAGEFALTPFQNPGGDFYAATVQQFSDYMRFDTSLHRIMAAAQQGASKVNTVSRSLNELTTAQHLLSWLQAEGQRTRYTSGEREVETDSAGVRFGAALPLGEIAGGDLVGGIEFGASRLSTDITNMITNADVDTDAYDATVSALWISQSQFYTDIQMRYAFFDGTIRPNGGASIGSDGRGYGISLELGKPFSLQNGLALIPQFQLMYSDIDADDVIDIAGGGVTGSTLDSETTTARLGLRAEYEIGGDSILFGQLDYFHSFDDETSVEFGGRTILTERGKNSAALTLGGHLILSQRASLYAEISGETGLGGNSSDYAVGGNVGWEFRF